MSSVSELSAPTPQLFVPRRVDASRQGHGLIILARLQNIMLAAWLAFVAMLPTSLYGLVALVILLPLWGLGVILGLRQLLKFSTKRWLAVWVMLAFPGVFMTAILLDSLFGLPIVDSEHGGWVVIGVLLAYPGYRLVMWLLRATRPIPEAQPEPTHRAKASTGEVAFKNETKPIVRRNLTDTLFVAVFGMLMLQSLLLVAILPFGDYFSSFKNVFGGEWYTNLLFLTLGTTAVLSVAAVPYAILRLIRGTPHKAAMIAILLFIAISVICTLGILFFFALLSAG